MTVLQPSLETMAQHLQDLIAERDGNLIRPRIIVTISGIPGSGKTTLATSLANLMNSCVTSEGVAKHYKTIALPMDGFHIPRSQLDAEGLRRRGAPHTFDAEAVVALVAKLKQSTYKPMPDITAPSFDHALKDPVADDLTIPRSTNVILLEGNYLLLEDEPWCKIAPLVTESWFLTCSMDVARERLAKRHLAAGLVDTLEAGLERVDFNDAPNGQYLMTHSLQPTVAITQSE